jgi:serine/threonine-protein kinase RsbW
VGGAANPDEVRVNRTAARNGGQRGEAGTGSVDTEPAAVAPADVPLSTNGAGEGRRHESTHDTVVLTLPASSAYLSVLRTATAGLAARLQFTLDEIEDLRIAVDEACAMLLTSSESVDRELTCRFELSVDLITVKVSVDAGSPALPSRDTFAWQVLTALAGAVEASLDGDQLMIQLTKRRGRAP